MLKGLQHRFLVNRAEYVELQLTILREKALEHSISDLRTHARNGVGANGGGGAHFSSEDVAEPRPLLCCLGDPGGTGSLVSGDGGTGGGSDDAVEVLDGHFFVADSDSDCSPDGEQWGWEDIVDPIGLAEFRELQGAGDKEIVDFYWAMRKATRRYSGPNY